MKLGVWNFFIRDGEIFGWRKTCMIMLFNEIVLEMHIFCATSILYIVAGGGVGIILEIHVLLYSNGNGGILEEVFVSFVLVFFFLFYGHQIW